jgi:hypothetical protein
MRWAGHVARLWNIEMPIEVFVWLVCKEGTKIDWVEKILKI